MKSIIDNGAMIHPLVLLLADRVEGKNELVEQQFDGFSISSIHRIQLALGIDRGSDLLAPLLDDRREALQRNIAGLGETAQRHGSKVDLCGHAPRDHLAFARFLVESDIDSMSRNPLSFIAVEHLDATADEMVRGG